MKHKDYFIEKNNSMASLGQFGLRNLTGNAIPTETFVAIQVLANAVITVDLVPYETPVGNIIGDTTLTSLSLTSGTIIYGRFVNLRVASGRVLAYKG